jgi:hypothetical protein
MRNRLMRSVPSVLLVAGVVATAAAAQTVPTPRSHFGFDIGEDRKLATWEQLTAYYARLAETSPRITIDTVGRATRGQPFVMLTVTSPENHARLAELRDINLRLADPRRISGEPELRDLIERGKTIVLITQNIHSTEVGAGQMAASLLYRLAASDEQKVREILDEVVLLHVPSLNPDGTQWVTEWYMETVGTPAEGTAPPWLYHYYIGHDNNRDWYAFTQVETQLAIEKAHNAWHPQIVHDVHQMGGNGARLFTPPYIDPGEPNIDPLLIGAVNQLGMYMAAEMTSDGFTGVVSNAIYDMYTPARAYQHYHGGARILTETASAQLATPVEVSPDALGQGRGYHAGQTSWNFPAPWQGGTWGLGDIVRYQEAAAMALLTNAARNRRFWLENFHEVGRRAVERWPSWPHAWVIPAGQANQQGVDAVIRILRLGDVEVHRTAGEFTAGGRTFPSRSYVIPMNQPYASFAQTMLEVQDYPDLFEYPGGPPRRPYDVTAHTLPLLMNVEAVPVTEALTVPFTRELVPAPEIRYEAPALSGRNAPRMAMYKGWRETMPAGWTRWVFDQHRLNYDTLHDARIRAGNLRRDYDVIVFQDQSPQQILRGLGDNYPEQYRGGVGAAGTAALKQFVEEGGRIVAIEEATDFAIDLFDLPVANSITEARPQDFYIPGSILRMDVDTAHAIGRGQRGESAAGTCATCVQTIAWYWPSSRAFEVSGDAKVVARYGPGNPRLSGWVLGPERVAGRPAIVEASVGRGSVVLFGFQPNYRAQTIATWPLLFNAMAVRRGN